MITVQQFNEKYTAFGKRMPTVADFAANYQRWMFFGNCLPDRILNVSTLPEWAIDMTCD